MTELLNLVWDLNAIKDSLTAMNLDTEKLPLGTLKIERIKKAHTILNEIQKQLPVNSTKEQRVADLTRDFYQMLPHNFGMKKPTNIDHVLRVKEKIKILESLHDIVITEQALIRAMDDLKEKDVANVLASELFANISELSRDQDAPCAAMVDTILNSIEGTHADAHKNLKVTVRHIF